MTRLSSQVIPADEVKAMVYAAVEDVLFAADTIAYNSFFFVSTADILQGDTNLSAISLAALLRGCVHGGLAVAPEIKDDGFRTGSGFLLPNINAAGRLGGLTDPGLDAETGRWIVPLAFYALDPKFELIDDTWRWGTKQNWTEDPLYAEATLWQKNRRFKFCSRVAGRSEFIYRKRS